VERPWYVSNKWQAKFSIILLKLKIDCYESILCGEHGCGLTGLADQLAVAMMGQTLAPAPPTAEQTVLPISAII
jgi:hypothetical protein